MAAKKDTVDASADEEAGLVPKGEAAEVDYTDTDAEFPDDGAYTDEVGEAVESAPEPVEVSPDAGPPHSTPSSPLEVSQARALYEDQVNADARAFADLAASEYVRATLGGFPVSIVVDDGLD